jgi:FKBP-type peptidyl-prolyl cis-trans isomerase
VTEKPIVVTLGQSKLIKGLELVLPLLETNRRVLVRIAPALAYGNQVVANVPANSTLIYLLELTEFD